MNNVTLKQLRAFVAVASEHSFTQAAQSLHVTQSTLTSAIKTLEAELETPLLDRSTRQVTLTHQGALFLPAAKGILRDLTHSLDDLRMMATREQGAVSVCAAGSFIRYILSPALIRMASRHPRIHARLTEGTTESVTSMVISGEADFGVSTLFEPVAELDTALLLSDTYGVIYGENHPLRAVHGPTSWSKLSRHQALQLNRGNGIRAQLDWETRATSTPKRTTYEVGRVTTLQALLEQGFGYSVLPALAARSLMGNGLCFHLLSRPRIRRELYVMKKKGRRLSPAATALLQAMVDALETLEPDTAMEVAFTREAMTSFCG